MPPAHADPLFASPGLLDAHGDAAHKLAFVVDMMRDLSRETDPQQMVANITKVFPNVDPAVHANEVLDAVK